MRVPDPCEPPELMRLTPRHAPRSTTSTRPREIGTYCPSRSGHSARQRPPPDARDGRPPGCRLRDCASWRTRGLARAPDLHRAPHTPQSTPSSPWPTPPSSHDSSSAEPGPPTAGTPAPPAAHDLSAQSLRRHGMVLETRRGGLGMSIHNIYITMHNYRIFCSGCKYIYILYM